MWRRTFEQLSKSFRRFAEEKRGSVAIYGGLVTALALGGGVLAIDLGKMEAIRNEMQNAADSAALSAALQLSGQAGARYNAEGVAIEAIDDYSRLVDDDNMAKFTTTSAKVKFYANLIDDPRVDLADLANPAEDALARYVEVTLDSEDFSLLMQPILALISSASSTKSVAMNARAIATSAGFTCEPVALFICNPAEENESGLVYDWAANGAANPFDVADWNMAGRQFIAKESQGGKAPAPGNFGLLCPPGTNNNCGASDTSDYFKGLGSDKCNAQDVVTNPGNQVNQANRGFNSRFDIGKASSADWYYAPNIINYYNDSDITDVLSGTEMLSNGSWMVPGGTPIDNVVDYWHEMHPNWGYLNNPDSGLMSTDTSTQAVPDTLNGVNNVPDILETLGATYDADGMIITEGGGATRYQTYLYELGVPFYAWRNRTLYPITDLDIDAINGLLPSGSWTLVENPNPSLPCRDNGSEDTSTPLSPPGAAGYLNARYTGDQPSFDGGTCASNGGPTTPTGWGQISKPDVDNDGKPPPQGNAVANTLTEEFVKRRVLLIAMLNCDAQSVGGKGTYEANTIYLQGFMTHHMHTPGASELEAALVVELIGPIVAGGGVGSSIATNAGVHTNVRLVE